MAIHIFRNNYPSAVDNRFICSLLDKDLRCSNMNFLIGLPNTEYTRCPVGCWGEAKVSCNGYWLIAGQGLLSLQQVKVEGNAFISSVSSLSFFFFSPLSLSFISFIVSYLSSPFLLEATQNDPQGLTCR